MKSGGFLAERTAIGKKEKHAGPRNGEGSLRNALRHPSKIASETPYRKGQVPKASKYILLLLVE